MSQTNSLEFKAKLGLDPSLTHYVQVGRQDGRELSASQKAHDLLTRAWRRSKSLGSSAGGELWTFMRARKKWWLAPVVTMLLLSALIVLTQGSAVAPYW